MRKLIVHEIDIHGNGYVQFNGSGFHYYYEDSGDVKAVIKNLIDIGFINKDDVLFIDDDEIYKILDEALANAEGKN